MAFEETIPLRPVCSCHLSDRKPSIDGFRRVSNISRHHILDFTLLDKCLGFVIFYDRYDIGRRNWSSVSSTIFETPVLRAIVFARSSKYGRLAGSPLRWPLCRCSYMAQMNFQHTQISGERSDSYQLSASVLPRGRGSGSGLPEPPLFQQSGCSRKGDRGAGSWPVFGNMIVREAQDK